MKISRTSPITGQVNTLDLDVTDEQIRRWERGELIQNVMPHLSKDQREFLISGCTQEDWDTLWGKAE